MSKGRFTPCYLLLAFMLATPFAAKSGSIVVNGTCELGVGTCPLPTDSLSNGQSTFVNFDFNVTVNGDLYSVTGSYSASYNSAPVGSSISVNPVVTYIGGAATSQLDTITFDLLQNYSDTTPGSWAGNYTESVPLSLEGPAGSTVQGQLLYDGVSVGLVGPLGPGSYFVTQSADLDFGDQDGADTLAADYNFVFNFAAGTTQGDSAASLTPEPVTTIPCGLGLILFAYGVRRRNRFRTGQV